MYQNLVFICLVEEALLDVHASSLIYVFTRVGCPVVKPFPFFVFALSLLIFVHLPSVGCFTWSFVSLVVYSVSSYLFCELNSVVIPA
jgi:hypothetical protein